MNYKRVRLIKNAVKNSQASKNSLNPVIYWMSRDQRIIDNWALIFSIETALAKKLPVIIIFNLAENFPDSYFRHYDFMLKNIFDVSRKAGLLNIPFLIMAGNPSENITAAVNTLNAECLVCDFDPIRIKREWKDKIAEKINTDFYEVDAHNIIPCWLASQKQEYGAYTIRPKINKMLPEFLEDYPQLTIFRESLFKNNNEFISLHNFNRKYDRPVKFIDPDSEKITSILISDAIFKVALDSKKSGGTFSVSQFDLKSEQILINNLMNKLNISTGVKPVTWITSGQDEALNALDEFINKRLPFYEGKSNDPTEDYQSGLSPYIHFGQISAQRVVLEILNKDFANTEAVHLAGGSFPDELIIRRELSDNFCNYNYSYDSFDGFPEWAKDTLNIHRTDHREYTYAFNELEQACTHDILWNATQMEMVKKGKMHGYMRMYWAKKILEWTKHPEEALEYAIILNNKYELDGRDPNGYTGIAWSIGGLHDRAWQERKIFGKIRYMSFEGIRKKFNIKKYISIVESL